MSKPTFIFLLLIIVCGFLIAILILQIQTPITKPATDFIKASTSIDLLIVKDKIIAGLTGVTAMSIGGILALVYGFWNRGKQLSSEIASKLQWKSQATDAGVYATALADEKVQTTELLSKVNAEKTALSSQLTSTKSQLETTAEELKRKAIEAETLSKQAAANFQSALPTNTLYTNSKTGAQLITVEKTVVK
jgi:hypothetical protein